MVGKTIICLANSRKISGRCVAGREVSANGIADWIRPISGRPTHELSEYERRYQNGQDPRLLDIVTVPVVAPRPHAYQVENYLIDPHSHWIFGGRATKAQLLSCIDAGKGPLWGNNSSYNGTNDRIDEHAAAALGESPKLIRVNDLTIQVSIEGAEFNNARRRVRGEFTRSGRSHLVSITDPLVERQYLAGKDGTFQVGEAILCVSLGDPHNGYAYMLIAGVILPAAVQELG